MSHYKFEISKLVRSKWSVMLTIGTAILYPLTVIIVCFLGSTEDNIAEGLFVQCVAFGVISYSQLFLFIPAWILMLVGNEFTNGFVQRYVFLKSRSAYIVSKIIFCTIVTVFFSLLGTIAFVFAVEFSAYPDLHVTVLDCIQLFVQMTVANLAFCLVLLSLIFVVRSTVYGFVAYFAWNFFEGIVATLLRKFTILDVEILPLHLIRSLFSTSGEPKSEDYFNPFFTSDISIVFLSILVVAAITSITFFTFREAQLKALSD
jgi:hypothetical protein